YYNSPMAIGLTFAGMTYQPGMTLLATGPMNFIPFNMPGTRFWAGVTFDNGNGATGATAAQMDALGVALFNPPVAGSSTVQMFETTDAGSFFDVANPAGSSFDIVTASAGWKFEAVPEPASLVLAGLGGLVVLRRRMAAS